MTLPRLSWMFNEGGKPCRASDHLRNYKTHKSAPSIQQNWSAVYRISQYGNCAETGVRPAAMSLLPFRKAGQADDYLRKLATACPSSLLISKTVYSFVICRRSVTFL